MIFASHKWKRLQRRLQDMHGGFLLLVLLLSAYGLMMQYSASGGDPFVFAIPQATKWVVGMVLFVGISLLPTRTLLATSYLFYGLCVLLLVVVQAMGMIGGGAQRWVNIGFFTLQPSEVMKLGLILALARYFHSATLDGTRHLLVLMVPIGLLAIPAVLILLQPNLGTATILAMVAYIMCFMAGIHWWYFAGTISAALAAVPIIYQFLHPYQQKRVMTFLDPASDPLGAGYNIIQSKIAIGSGGFFGKGLLNGSQGQLDFLPEKQTDFIFTMLAEELGFFGALILLIFYGAVLWFAIMLAVRTRHAFGRMIAVGVAAMLFVHVFINMAMVMGMIPVVGVPLPFLSYGGSFMIATLAACGLLMHVYMNRELNLPKGGGF